MPDSSPTGVSVVIPTVDRTESLERTLAAVARAARRLEEPAEAIVVYDGDGRGADLVPPSTTVDGLRVRRVRARDAGASGPAEARNAGVAAASFDLLAFTDDDALPDERWLERAVRRLREDPGIAGVEGAVRVDFAVPLDPVRARIVMNVCGGAYLTASLFVRRAAFERVGGFRRLRAGSDGWRIPYREDTDLALRIVRDAGPIPFDPDAFVLHPPEAVSLPRLVRLARYFVVDGAFARLHPDAVPSVVRSPLARLRIRLATAAALVAPALLLPRSRRVASAAMLAIAAAVSAQFEVELRSGGARRPLLTMIRDSLLRLPRALVWSIAAGAARLEGEALIRLRVVRIPENDEPQDRERC